MCAETQRSEFGRTILLLRKAFGKYFKVFKSKTFQKFHDDADGFIKLFSLF